MEPVGLVNTRISIGYAQKFPEHWLCTLGVVVVVVYLVKLNFHENIYENRCY